MYNNNKKVCLAENRTTDLPLEGNKYFYTTVYYFSVINETSKQVENMRNI